MTKAKRDPVDQKIAKDTFRMLAFLNRSGPARVMPVQDKNGDRVLLNGHNNSRMIVQPGLLTNVQANDLASHCVKTNHLTITQPGKAWLKRYSAEKAPAETSVNPHRAQHGSLRASAIRMADGHRQAVCLDDHESPLVRLHRTKRPGGGTWLDDAAVAAGERLRSDFTHGGLMQRTTSSWNFETGVSGKSVGRGLKADLADSAIDARQRVTAALDRVGPELAGVVMDVCCFLKGLESVERERRWPPRSAKLMLRTALNILATHYGTKAGRQH